MLPAAVLLVACAMASRSARPVTSFVPHVRTAVARIGGAVRQGYDRSPTFKALVDQIEASQIVVFIGAGRCRLDAAPRLEGCTAVLARTPSVRYGRVVVDVGERTIV